jgi:hypothetical protein
MHRSRQMRAWLPSPSGSVAHLRGSADGMGTGVAGVVVVVGFAGAFLSALSAALLMIAHATGGFGEDED